MPLSWTIFALCTDWQNEFAAIAKTAEGEVIIAL